MAARKASDELISLVIPAFNEAESLPELHREIDAVAERADLNVEILFVDDGSRDGTWSRIARLAESDTRVRGIRFRRNRGKAAALSVGFAEARGAVIATLDADLQDDPAELPRFLERLDKGCDLVVGWKKTRHDPWHRVWPSRVWNGLANAASGLGVHDHNCGFKVMWRDVAAELDLYGELHRYIPILAHARGFGVAEIEVHHRPRKYGQSKYGARRFLRGLVDLGTVTFLTRAGDKPAHVLGGWGACVGLAGLGLLAIAGLCTVCRIAPGTRATLGWLGVVGGVLGVKLAALGLVAELVVSHAGRGGRARQPVAEHVGGTDASPDGTDAR